MNTKHTPGPWRVTKCIDDKRGEFYIRGTNESGADMPLAVTRHGPQDANADLIAAAPELIHAVELAEAQLRKMDYKCDCENLPNQCPLCACYTAIAKAKGE